MTPSNSRPPGPAMGTALTGTERAKQVMSTRKGRIGLTVIALTAVLSFAALWNPPITTQHDFTTASDYSAARDAGCTNSGEGCHGAETEYANFNDYHPNTDCTTCHDYTGVGCIPCHTPTSHECAACHDGSMPGASDCVRLVDPFPNGHYRETTHTAMGTDMDQVVLSAMGGSAQATCEACHSRDLKDAHTGVPVVAGSPYGESVGCGECHNDVRSNGLAQVLADWESRTCEECHAVGSSSPMHSAEIADSVESSGTAGCAATGSGCHDVDDLHLLHPDAPETCSGSAAEGEAGCHDLEVESHAPTARACGGGDAGACHQPYANDLYTHKNDRTNHSPKSPTPANGRYEGVACGSCHYMSTDGTSLVTEHDLATSARTNDTENSCRNCHNDPASLEAIEGDWSVRDTSYACSTCHGSTGLDAAHSSSLSAVHTITSGSEGCAESGAGCHPESDLSRVGSATGALHDDCLTCHDRTASGTNLSYNPTATTCGEGRDCHSLPGDYTSGDSHGETTGRGTEHAAAASQASAALFDAASDTNTRCDTCHDMTLGVEHTREHASIATESCTGCHNASAVTAAAVKDSWPAGTCETCHSGASAAHSGKDTAHTATELDRTTGLPSPGSCAKPGCHATLDLRVLHAAKGCDNAGCHSATGAIRGTGITSCGGPADSGGCHAGNARHTDIDSKHQATERNYATGEPEVGSCAHAGCHATADVRELHVTTHCYDTAGCHMVGGPEVMTCGGPEGTPACHAGSLRHSNSVAKHTATELDKYGDPAPGSCAKAGCHATVDVKALHVTTHCYDTAGCHMVGGPRLMTCGGPDGADSCHTSSNRHANYTDKHQATEIDKYGDPSPGGCVKSGCHPTIDVRYLHVTGRCYNTPGCHMADGPSLISCGGPEGFEGCHAGSERHRVDHSADTTGTVNGITYGPGENEGCVDGACHVSSLTSEHSARRTAGTLEGTSANSCTICHAHPDDPGNGTYSELTAVKTAIANHDKRCIACHAGGPVDGPVAVASPTPACVIAPPASPAALPRILESVPESASTVDPVGSTPASVPASIEATTPESPDPDPIPEPETPAEDQPEPEVPLCVGEETGSSESTTAVRLESVETDLCLTCHVVQ